MENNSGYIRSFVAVLPSADTMRRFSEYAAKLKTFMDFKWVELPQLHITLRFLGDSEPGQIQKIDTALSRIGGIRPFTVRTKTAGAFPSLERPNVVWLGIGGGARELEKLAARVEQAARSADFAPESRGFRAHLTLGRRKKEGELPAGLRDLLRAAPQLEWRCDGFALVKSVLRPSGPEYATLGTYALD